MKIVLQHKLSTARTVFGSNNNSFPMNREIKRENLKPPYASVGFLLILHPMREKISCQPRTSVIVKPASNTLFKSRFINGQRKST